MNDFITIFCTIWGILNIALFFKVWGMCDNVARLTEKIAPNVKENIENKKEINIVSIGATILIMGAIVYLIFSLV